MAKDTRLQKMLADCGVASRRKAEEMIPGRMGHGKRGNGPYRG